MQVLTWTSGSGLFSSPAWEYATPMGHAHAAYVVVSSVVYHLSCKVRRPAIRNRTTHHNHTRENAPSPDSRAHMLTNSQRPHYHPAQHGMMENRIKHRNIAHCASLPPYFPPQPSSGRCWRRLWPRVHRILNLVEKRTTIVDCGATQHNTDTG